MRFARLIYSMQQWQVPFVMPYNNGDELGRFIRQPERFGTILIIVYSFVTEQNISS